MPPPRTSRPGRATVADLGAIALSLPEVESTIAWGDRPSYTVRGKAFVIFREPRADAVDPDTGERMDDVVVISVADRDGKEALLGSGPPWFTTSHFDGYNAVLVRERDIGMVGRDELEEVVTDAWLARAPKRLATVFLDSR
jgi:hypothetical protein